MKRVGMLGGMSWESSAEYYCLVNEAAVMSRLVDRGAETILLGCTEIDLLVGPGDASVPLFDTTRLHSERAVELALPDFR
jgi:aspartate/glutamate racemase